MCLRVHTTQQYPPPPKLIYKLTPHQLFVLSRLRPQIITKAVEYDHLVELSAARSRKKILFVASTELTEKHAAGSSIITRSKTKSKKKAVIKKEKDYLVALSASRSERMLSRTTKINTQSYSKKIMQKIGMKSNNIVAFGATQTKPNKSQVTTRAA